MKNKVEIMAPAGGFDSLMAAIQGGAHSVYFGVEQLNMRARATMNFSLEDVPEVARICKEHHLRSYITLNTIVYDHDLSLIKTIVNAAKEAGITAIIAADQAVIAYARSVNMEVHISTQVNVTNIETVKFYALFADTIVLARELSLMQVKKITDAIKAEQIKGPSGRLIEIELFVHGALCMAVSGKCYLSLHTHNASANRGACIQNCRRTYQVTDREEGHELAIENEYIMSAQDLCTIDFIDQVLDAGVHVLKIEGRGKGPEYVKTVTQCYREATDAFFNGTYTPEKAKAWKEKMENVYNRGFWSGYYLGQKLGEWTNTHGSKAKLKKIYLGKGSKYFSKLGVAEFYIETHTLKVGDRILITGHTTGAIETTVDELHTATGPVTEAIKGDLCSVKLDTPIRKSDKLYKLVSTAE
ncbi:MAG: U32 family peptidase [Bacteroidetes bacterium]|nr:U32 family peptidase [Bacteroidota bacterium]